MGSGDPNEKFKVVSSSQGAIRCLGTFQIMSKDKKLVVVFSVDSTFISLVKLGELSKLS